MNKEVKKNVFLTLLCEWAECSHVYDNMESFLLHIKGHLEEWRSRAAEPEKEGADEEEENCQGYRKEGGLLCRWKDCFGETKLKTWDDLSKHVHYHAFHQKLKCHGIALLHTLGEPLRFTRCQLDQGGRNLLPDLPFELVCCWQDCQAKFENPEAFYSHVVSHMEAFPSGNDVKGGCKCLWETCQVCVKSKHKLRDHLRSHTQEKQFACPTCGGLFANATKFIDHVQRQTELDSLTYRCSYCSKMFPNKRLLRDHMRHHVYHYKCPFCEMTCPTPSSLRTHIRYRHSNYRPFICKSCGFTAKLAVDLKKHLESHDDDWIDCQFEDCVFRSRYPWEMNLHVRNKHQGLEESKYLCHLCSQKYSRGTYLTKHLKKKHRLREPSGHVRLRYKLHDDGFYRLQEFRYESSELREQRFGLQEKKSRRRSGADDDDDDDDGSGGGGGGGGGGGSGDRPRDQERSPSGGDDRCKEEELDFDGDKDDDDDDGDDDEDDDDDDDDGRVYMLNDEVVDSESQSMTFEPSSPFR